MINGLVSFDDTKNARLLVLRKDREVHEINLIFIVGGHLPPKDNAVSLSFSLLYLNCIYEVFMKDVLSF